jgi:hypothetical protein
MANYASSGDSCEGLIPQIPDGVLYKNGLCWVVDASIVSDNADLTMPT